MKPIAINVMLCGLALFGGTLSAGAQVRFKLSQLNPDRYQVSLVADKTLPASEAITGTMQVTFKIKSADKFVLANVQSALTDVEWDKGSSLRSPDGAADFDYVSVALRSVGTRGIGYTAGKEVALFTFTNAGNTTARPVLLENDIDPLVSFRHNKFNIQNHLSVLGYGRVNAYTGNLGDANGLTSSVEIRSVFPNPASAKTTVTYENRLENRVGDVSFALIEAGTGRVIQREQATMQLGINHTELTVSQLSAGTYVIQLEQAGAKLGLAAKLLIAR